MTNKLNSILILIGILISSFAFSQIEELEPTIEIKTETDPEEEGEILNINETTEEEYKDTWKTPYVSDEMTADPEQNKSWRMGEYKYNARPRNSWEIGLHGGHYFIDGDVDRKIPAGFGAGVHLRKAINYAFSLRGSLFYGVAKGQESQPYNHRNVGGIEEGGGLYESTFNAYDPLQGGPGHWFPNHKTTYIAADMAIVLNIGNLLFHKERNKWNWYAAVGIGLDHHETKLDLLNGAEPYENLREQVDYSIPKFNTKAGRDDIESKLGNIYDGIYETDGFKKVGIFRVGDDFNIHVVFMPSMGISRKINKRINIGLEHQVMLSDNDYLDGIKWRTAKDQTNNVDIGHYTHARIGINIGNFDKVTEPLYWLNPYDAAFNDIADLKSKPSLDLTDEDNDGVLDIIDQELDTPEDCAVDTRGVLLDSDGDGIVDCEDKEPYSRPGCPIDEVGVAQCEEECCADEESINQLIDERTAGMKQEIAAATEYLGGQTVQQRQTKTVTNPDGTTRTETVMVPVTSYGAAGANGANGATGATGATGAAGAPGRVVRTSVRSGCGEWFLPMIHYDLNKSSIKPEYFSHLHNVAQVLKKCPEVCVVAQGHTDSRNSSDYNRVLSYKRSKSAVDYLVDNYSIDRSRIKLMYGGEENPMVASPNSEAHHFMNRRVEFRTCDASDFDMAEPEGYTPSGSDGSSAPARSDYYNGNKSSGY